MQKGKLNGKRQSERIDKLHQELEKIQNEGQKELEKRRSQASGKKVSPLAAALQSVAFEQERPQKEVRKTPSSSEKKVPTGKPTYLEESQLTKYPQTKETDKKREPKVQSKTKTFLWVGLGLLLVVVLGVGGYFFVNKILQGTETMPANWEECFNAKTSVIQESYPRVCVTKDGTRFVEPVSVESLSVTPTPTVIIATPTIFVSSPSATPASSPSASPAP